MATTISNTRTIPRKVQVQTNFENLAYFFMRMSGISLLLLAVGHIFVQLILNDVHNLTLIFVQQQWDAWGWKAYDMLLLIFALAHGLNGLRNILGDYVHNPRRMQIVSYVLLGFFIITVIVAGYGIAAFDPNAAGSLLVE